MSEELDPTRNSPIVLYHTPDGKVTVDVFFAKDNFWLTQKAMAELFGVKIPAISKHLKNIFDSGELAEGAAISKMETVQTEGTRQVSREVDFYNLGAVIAVGYRVNSVTFTEQQMLKTAGKISHEMAVAKAHDEYDRYRPKQDQAYISEFDQKLAKYLNGRDKP